VLHLVFESANPYKSIIKIRRENPMNEEAFNALINLIKTAGTDLDLSNKSSYRQVVNNQVLGGVDLSQLTSEQARQFKEAMIEAGPRILKLNLSRHLLSNLGSMHSKRMSGHSNPTSDESARIVKDVFEGIAACKNLEELRMTECDLEWFCIGDSSDLQIIVGSTLAKLTRLKVLDISKNSHYCHRADTTVSLYAAIAESNIDELNLSACNFGKFNVEPAYGRSKPVRSIVAEVFGQLAKMKKLKKLVLTGNDLTSLNPEEWGYVATSLKSIATLQDIDIRENGFVRFVNEESIPKGILHFLHEMQRKYVAHDLSCATDIATLRQHLREGNIVSAINVASRVNHTHPEFITVRFEVFQAQYFALKSEGKSARAAFKTSVPLLTFEGKIIALDDQQLRVFDSCLCQYFGKQLAPNSSLTLEERADYLHQFKVDTLDFCIILEQYPALPDFLASIPLKQSVGSRETCFLMYTRSVSYLGVAKSAAI
jgi:hypothetical protein